MSRERETYVALEHSKRNSVGHRFVLSGEYVAAVCLQKNETA